MPTHHCRNSGYAHTSRPPAPTSPASPTEITTTNPHSRGRTPHRGHTVLLPSKRSAAWSTPSTTRPHIGGHYSQEEPRKGSAQVTGGFSRRKCAANKSALKKLRIGTQRLWAAISIDVSPQVYRLKYKIQVAAESVSLCLRSKQGEWHEVPRGFARSLRNSENQLLSVCFHRKAVSAEWNISLNTILSTLNTFLTPPALRATSPINCAPLREQGRTRCSVWL